MSQMRQLIYLISIVIFCAYAGNVSAQIIPISPNCPPPPSTANVQIFGADSINCGSGLQLTAAVTGAIVGGTDSYLVSSVPYAPFPWVGTNSITSILSVDDVWSDSIAMPFTFCFFGQSFNQFIASSNGSISFNTVNASGTNAWSTSSWGPMPVSSATSGGDFDWTICGAHYDLLPTSFSTNKAITWDVYGTAPCRALVISWDSIPLFSCTTQLGSQQIILYESTNIIDVVVKEKTNCGTWNLGIGYLGIQNNGFTAFTAPGKNGTIFTDSLKQYRFEPFGTTNSYTIQWVNAATGALVGTGATLSLPPLPNGTYNYAVNVYSCPNTLRATDTQQVKVINTLDASFTAEVNLGCDNDTIVFTNTSTPANSYFWQFSPTSASFAQQPGAQIYQNQGIYTVSLTASNGGLCIDTMVRVFDLRHPIDAICDFDSTICLYPATGLNGTVNINNFTTGGGLVQTFDFGDGTINTFNGLIGFVTHQYTSPGAYNFVLSIVDTLGCVDTFRRTVFVEGIPFAFISASDSSICVGYPVAFNDSITTLAASWKWIFPDNPPYELQNVNDPIFTFQNPTSGTQNVVLEVSFLYCPTLSVNLPVQVSSYPVVNLGPDTAYCEGYSAPIQLNNLSFGSSSLLWSTGTSSPSLLITTPGTYWAQANNNSCLASDTVIVKEDCYINIPNAFTPGNGDDVNTYFMPTNDLMRGAKSYSLEIYNRWGEQVFTTTNVNSKGWDGKLTGVQQPMGTYIYLIKVQFKNKISKEYKGNVTLLR
jgi:gliding motility-associated-like protein